MGELKLTELSKVFRGGVQAVSDLTLDIRDGEFVVLLGPSGCGKTTVLRMIAGLEEATAGTIELDGCVLNNVAERDRDIAMVFQNYALYPHMSAYRNIEYPLRHRRIPKDRRKARVQSVATTLGLSDLLDKKPAELSGGQRQRVAMGRAMVREPKMFLMDEPLSNLDAALRGQMRTEIHALQRRLGVTTLFVTHDQVEAMTLSDRIAVIRDGRLQQVGSPGEIYELPANAFVAAFMGSPGMRLFNARLSAADDGLYVELQDHAFELDQREETSQPSIRRFTGRDIIFGVRPESLSLVGSDDGAGSVPRRSMPAVVEFQEALGSSVVVYFSVDGLTGSELRETKGGGIEVDVGGTSDQGGDTGPDTRILMPARLPPSARLAHGERVQLMLRPGAMRFFDPSTGAALS
jgi:multiple sugar transport system ATP-binding protein